MTRMAGWLRIPAALPWGALYALASVIAWTLRRVVRFRLSIARANLQRECADNVTVIEGDGAQGWPAQAPYDAIVLSGSVAQIPEALLEQLKVGGRLLAVVGDAPLMQARLVTCVADGQFQSANLFETSIPRLRNVPERGTFFF